MPTDPTKKKKIVSKKTITTIDPKKKVTIDPGKRVSNIVKTNMRKVPGGVVVSKVKAKKKTPKMGYKLRDGSYTQSYSKAKEDNRSTPTRGEYDSVTDSKSKGAKTIVRVSIPGQYK